MNFLAGPTTDKEIEGRFRLEKVEHWSLSDTRELIREEGVKRELVRRLAYRPFDTHYYYDHDALVFRRRHKVMQQMIKGDIGLAVCRLTKGGIWGHCMVAGEAADDSFVSDKSKERAYLYPLYWTPTPALTTVSEGAKENAIDATMARNENLSSEFRSFMDARYRQHYTPEEILGYIYAVLHAPIYRTLYAEFLRIDFPRIPFPHAAEDFETLSVLGWALVQAHLLRELPQRALAAYHGKGGHTVEAVRYVPADQAVAINKTQFFKPVTQAVWDLHIGGYQVLDKYLKSRKDRVLSLNEINHVGAIADILAFTIEQMDKIDMAYRAAFPERG